MTKRPGREARGEGDAAVESSRSGPEATRPAKGRVLLLLPTTTYRTDDFLAAAVRMGVALTVASEETSTMARLNPAAHLTLPLDMPARAAEIAAAFARQYPLNAVVAVDEAALGSAAAIAKQLGLRHNPIEAVRASSNKLLSRRAMRAAGVRCPEFRHCRFDEDRNVIAGEVDFPCVVKPLARAASQGVIRADDPVSLAAAIDRLEAILRDTGTGDKGDEEETFLIERFVSGAEVALEGLLTDGRLEVLALFDKPDPLDGPFFEETIYVTPSRLDESDQQALAECAQQAAAALGLVEGPVHAELRLGDQGPTVIEVHARSIGGYCSRALRFATDVSLEELILRHALDGDESPPSRAEGASGVMMIPVPRAGVLESVGGLSRAESVPGIDGVKIAAHGGQRLVPLPEGSVYLGFIFARGDKPETVEAALRTAHARLRFEIS